ncbi:SOS response-associated peptidase [Pseudomonas nicosulfuronedens]|uniref:Abasic site processing protein n=1 Tax=Pseudomonas nicosulfuronedens TaxID=2571105 RepID=A0A5R9R7C0_9PSED|nr:SOS response-associated peptidase [Pseudomonas nicosulfuronedens]MDH1009758.1 SOS response-associated peptidase [Pseudomonas nicosulfuronedens]MDH1982357.1 SOS response-associated peptidase [Pseudomonas nicosulfuronedens]MDH2027682.1 SOS response-associated peptidase [Pseudomonas nicosulfuronedens]TLX78590.1 SOS response-associated peptidase [Pseudomonas nicosulfuronedens]
MTSRYALFRWNRELADSAGFPADLQPQWSIAPGARVLMLREESSARHADLARWGLTPAWLKDLSRTPAHARTETIAEQPMFRDAFALRRCLLPANGFYEWRGVRKRPHWISGGGLICFAGVWEAYPVEGHTYYSVAMLTQDAGGMRRPLILDAAEQAQWLSNETPSARLLELLQLPQARLREQALANFINDPTCNGPECLTPA